MEKLSKKEKILLAISILGVGATSYLYYKYGIENNKLKNIVDEKRRYSQKDTK